MRHARLEPYFPGDEACVFRPEDEAESMAAVGKTCSASIADAFASGQQVLVGRMDETPVIFFGAAKVTEEAAAVWMLATPELPKYKRQLLVQAPQWIAEQHKKHPLLFNYVDARNTLHIAWLKRLGFTFIHLHERWGTAGIPFYEFVRIPDV